MRLPASGAVAGAAADNDHAAAHSRHLSGQWAAEMVLRVAVDIDDAALHARRRPGAGVTVQDQVTSRQQSSGLGADIAVDRNFAAGHGLADAIEPIACAFDANALRVAHAQTKNLSDIDARPRRLQFDTLDLRRRFAGKEIRNERRQIEPLVGALPQRENHRSHGSKSRKW
jgi:hypothetical protein